MSIDTDALTHIEQALTTLLGRGNLPRMHERLMQATGMNLERAAYVVVSRLGDVGAMRLSDLAANLGLDISTVSRHVAQLERDGLVDRRPDPTDGRSTILDVTSKGEEALERVRQARRIGLAKLLNDWSADDLGDLAGSLERLASDVIRFTAQRS